MAKLRIVSVSYTADFIPQRKCLDTLYAPFYFADPSPAIAGRTELLYLMGGHVDAQQTPGLSSPGRFADKIYYCYRQPDGTWSNPELIIQKSFFPWMGNDDFLAANPQTFVGSVAGPNVIKINGTYVMFFCASISDPNICTGEHPQEGTPHGSCLVPWSYFVMYLATSNDGEHWTLRDMARPNDNIALQYAVAYYAPSAAEASGSFKGLAMPHGVIYDGQYLYLFHEFWATIGLRNALLRASGTSGQFEIWNGGGWDTVTNGVLPSWINTDLWKGNPYPHIINQVARTTQMGSGHPYLLTAQGAGSAFGGQGVNNCVEYAVSNDLVNWSGIDMAESELPHVADGTGADNTVLNPIYLERDNTYQFLWASNDYNLDGQPDCDGPYPGLAIFAGDPTAKQTTNVNGRHRAAGVPA